MGKYMRKELGKWQLVWRNGQSVEFHTLFANHLDFGLLKLVSIPDEGTKIRKRNYKGFLWSFYYPVLIRREKRWP